MGLKLKYCEDQTNNFELYGGLHSISSKKYGKCFH